MKYAIHDLNTFGINTIDKDAIVEAIVPYKGQVDALKSIGRAREKGLRMILDLPPSLFDTDFDTLVRDMLDLVKVYNDIGFRLARPSRALMRQVPNCFLNYTYAAGTYQDAITQISSGASEVYVTGSLAASREELAVLSSFVKIRMIPNVVQTNAYMFGNPGEVDPLKCFWLRPEGVKNYEGSVSIMEFIFINNEREAALINTYNSGEYTGNLGLLIHDHTMQLNEIESFYDNVIDHYRSSCGLRCQSIGKCNVCQRIPTLTSLLRQAEEKKRVTGFLT